MAGFLRGGVWNRRSGAGIPVEHLDGVWNGGVRTPAEVDPPAELIQGYQTPGLFSVAEICSWLPRLAFSPATCRFWLVTTRSSVFYYCSDKISDKKQGCFFSQLQFEEI